MKIKKTACRLAGSLWVVAWLVIPAAGAQTSVFTPGLNAPVQLISTPGGNLLVAEGGDGTNRGRVSLVDRAGVRRSLVEGLPGALASEGIHLGPSGVALVGRTLFVTIAAGDTTVGGEFPGTEVPNPDAPSSPLMSSVIVVHLSRSVDLVDAGFTLDVDDHFDLANGLRVTRGNGEGDVAELELLADFRDLVRTPGRGPERANSFDAAVDLSRQAVFLVDATRNSIEQVSLLSGRIQRLIELPPIPNPLPFGPPLIDAVPTSVHLFNRKLLVGGQTGFPFPAGLATIALVDPDLGTASPFITGLTTAIDALAVEVPGEGTRFYVVELSTSLLSGAPGRLLRFDDPQGAPTVLADTLSSPTAVARDAESGDLFVTEVFTGNVVRVSDP